MRPPTSVPAAEAGPDLEPVPQRPGPRGAPRWVRLFTVAVFVLATGAFFTVMESAPDAESRPEVLLLWVVAYAISGFALFDGALRLRLRIPAPLPLVLFVVLAVASYVWSVAPDITLRRAVGLLGTALVGLLLAQRLQPVEILDALRRATLVIAIASLAFFASGDPAAIDELHETLRGVVATKNTLGRTMALGLLACAGTALLDRERLRRSAVSAVPMVVALVLTDSTGGMLMAFLVVAGATVVALWGKDVGKIAVAGGLAVVLGALLALTPTTSTGQVLELIGEDTTLTGRDEVWRESLDAAGDRPLLGYGYGAFWEASEPAERIQARLQWSVPNAHNALLDVGLDLGLVGVVLALAVLVALFVQGIVDAAGGRRQGAVLRLSLAAFVAISTLVESGLLQQNALLTVLLVAALAARDPARAFVRRRLEGVRQWS